MARKILITGAEGQLGKALQIGLTDKFNILSTTRQPTQLAKNQRNVQKLDITDKENISNVLESFKPDIIINCAAYTNVDGSEINKDLAHQVNVEGLRNLIQLSDINTYLIQYRQIMCLMGIVDPIAKMNTHFLLIIMGKQN